MSDLFDLNDWRLVYPGVEFGFGTIDTGYPLTTQVDIGTPDASDNDGKHPNADGVVFGIDSRGGRTLTFEVGIPKVYGKGQRWAPNLDAQETFAATWDAEPVRRTAGAVCELYNDNRDRMVYGRPRNLKPKLDKARQGWSELTCDFKTSDARFYGALERELVVPAVIAAARGFSFPLTFPWLPAEQTMQTLVVTNDGTRDTWPTIEFAGPSTNSTVQLIDQLGGVAWQVNYTGALAYDETAVVETRPWVRSVQVNGRPALGQLRGSPLYDCKIPPGTSQVRYLTTDLTGSSTVTLRYRDAYASL